MIAPSQWQRFYTLVYSTRHRNAAIVPVILEAEYIRVEVEIFTFPRPTFYRAGWLSQTVRADGKHLSFTPIVCPLHPAIFKFDPIGPYYLKFSPVDYLPNCTIGFWRAAPTQP